MKKNILLLFLIVGCLYGKGQNYHTIGQNDVSSGSEKDQFLPPTFSNAKVNILLRNMELTSSGMQSGDYIIGVEWYVNTDQTPNPITYDVYITDDYLSDTIPATVIYPTVGADFPAISPVHVGSTLVDSGQFVGWHSAMLTTPMVWDGTDNMMVQVCRSGFNQSPADFIAVYNDTVNTMISGYQSQCSSTTGLYVLRTKPWLRLVTCNPSAATTSISVCNNYTSPSGKVWTTSNTYMDTIPNATGCDSIITIDLTVNITTSDTISEAICSAYTSPSGKVFSVPGNYVDTIANGVGCDSIINIQLSMPSLGTNIVRSGDTLRCTTSNVTYQWLDCNAGKTPISGAIDSVFIGVTGGSYAIVVQRDDCIDTSACKQIVVSNMQHQVQKAIQVFPNPNTGSFVLTVDETFAYTTLEVTDLSGKVVFTKSLSNETLYAIDLDMNSGVYLFQLKGNQESTVIKVLIKK